MEHSESRFERALDVALKVPASLAVVVMMLHVSGSALGRTFASRPLGGTLEYTEYWYLPMIAFIGIVIAQRRGEHVEARLLFDRFPGWAQRTVEVLSALLFIALALAFAWYSWDSAADAREIGRRSVTGVTIWPVMYTVPVTFVLVAVQLGIDLVRGRSRTSRTEVSNEVGGE